MDFGNREAELKSQGLSSSEINKAIGMGKRWPLEKAARKSETPEI